VGNRAVVETWVDDGASKVDISELSSLSTYVDGGWYLGSWFSGGNPLVGGWFLSVWFLAVTIQPCPSSKQAVDRSIAALKRRACDFMGQPRSSGEQQKTDDDAGLSYLESAEAYEYNTLTIGQMIMK
jgi:hypothetical protein